MKNCFKKTLILVLLMAMVMPIALTACGDNFEDYWFENAHPAFSQFSDAFRAEGYTIHLSTRIISDGNVDSITKHLAASKFSQWFNLWHYDCLEKATNSYNVMYLNSSPSPSWQWKGQDGLWVWNGSEDAIRLLESIQENNNTLFYQL
ncbi:MAG: hypothetical protein FWE03_01250 [Firmicutes bacterium]|nr:hypothetical protein [Bacillota bacterium]